MELITLVTIGILMLSLFASAVAAYYLTQRSKYVGEHTVDTDADGNFVLQRSSEHPIRVAKPSDGELSDETARLAAAGHVAKNLPVLLPTHGDKWDLVDGSVYVDPSSVTDSLTRFSVAYRLNDDVKLKDSDGLVESGLPMLTMSHPITKIRSLSLHGPVGHTSTSSVKNMVFGLKVVRGTVADTIKTIGFGTDLTAHAGLATEGDLNLALRIDGSAFASEVGHSLHGTGGMLGTTDAFHVPSTETVLELDGKGNVPLIPETSISACGKLVNCDTLAMPEIHLSLEDTDMTTVTLKAGTILYCEFKGPLIHLGVGDVRNVMSAVGLEVKTATGAGTSF